MAGDSAAFDITVVFEDRPDGGLRVYSDDVPGFLLSHPDKDAVLSDVKPALETILAEMLGHRVLIEAAGNSRSLPWLENRKTKGYRALRAA